MHENGYQPTIANGHYFSRSNGTLDSTNNKQSKIPTKSKNSVRNEQDDRIQTQNKNSSSTSTKSNNNSISIRNNNNNNSTSTRNNNNLVNNLNLSRSLSSLIAKPTIIRSSVPSPRRSGKQLFTQLSPIIGTPKMSPEPNAPKPPIKSSKSAFVLLSNEDSTTNSDENPNQSPSKIPRSTSFHRLSKSIDNLTKALPNSRIQSRNASPTRNSQHYSREPSPSKKPPRVPRRKTITTAPELQNNFEVIQGPNSSTAKQTPQTRVSRALSMKNLSKPKVQPRSTSPAAKTKPPMNNTDNLNRLNAPRTSKSRGASPNRLNVPKLKYGQSSNRDASPNGNKKSSTPKSPTKIPTKSSSYRNVSSKIDSHNKVRPAATKPKVPPKPSGNDSNPKSKLVSRNSKTNLLSRQSSRDSNADKNENKSKLTKSSSSKKLIDVPESASNDQTDSNAMDSRGSNETSNRNMEEMNSPNDLDDIVAEEVHDVKPSVLAEKLQQMAGDFSSNVVSVTTETVTVPLQIEAPKPQVPLAPVENLLTKNVLDKPSDNGKRVLTKTDTQKSLRINSSPKPAPRNPSNAPPISDNTQNVNSVNNKSNERTEGQSDALNAADSNICNVFGPNVKEEDKRLENAASSVPIIVNNTVNNKANTGTVKNDKTVIVSDKLKPIQIQVKEQGTNLDVQSGNVGQNAANLLAGRSPSNGTLAGLTPR